MYDVNNVHILVYVAFGILALFVGRFVAWINMRLSEEKKVFSKDYFEIRKQRNTKNLYLYDYYSCFISCIIT